MNKIFIAFLILLNTMPKACHSQTADSVELKVVFSSFYTSNSERQFKLIVINRSGHEIQFPVRGTLGNESDETSEFIFIREVLLFDCFKRMAATSDGLREPPLMRSLATGDSAVFSFEIDGFRPLYNRVSRYKFLINPNSKLPFRASSEWVYLVIDPKFIDTNPAWKNK